MREKRSVGVRTFDLERVRQNWERARPPPSPQVLPSRLAVVTEPRDPYPIAVELLADARRLASSELGDRAPKLRPFFDRAEDLLGQMRAATPGEPAEALRAEFLELIEDLGELADVLATIRR